MVLELRMFFNWFSHCLVHHPFVILIAVTIFSCTCIMLPFTSKSVSVPNFKDPQMGFITRGTEISNRLTTWKNLIEATRPSGVLTSNPKEYFRVKHLSKTNNKVVKKKQKKSKLKHRPVYGSISTKEVNNSSVLITADRWKTLQDLHPGPKKLVATSRQDFFCGSPNEAYAQLVLASTKGKDLFTLKDLLAMCQIENYLISTKHYKELCFHQSLVYKKKDTKKCCTPWTLPNYVAVLNNRTSCLAITEEDIIYTKDLLMECSQYFFNNQLNEDCFENNGYCEAPAQCIKHDAVFNILNFIASQSFLSPHSSKIELKEVMIFLPLSHSTAIMPYYHEIKKLNLHLQELQVVAIDFGIKSAIFDEYLIEDTWLMGSGILFIFFCIWIYTNSFFLTIMTIIVIMFSLAIAYFMYTLVYQIKFFPFMNLLAIVVAIGIGSDDVFIFCKTWSVQKQKQIRVDNNKHFLDVVMTHTFNHALVCMFVTAITTAVAFLGSYISSVTAISCFSIFAGTAVIVNYLLMMTWFPASIVIWEKSYFSRNDLCSNWFKPFCHRYFIKSSQCGIFTNCFEDFKIDNLPKLRELFFVDVLKLKLFWLMFFTTLAVVSAFVVFYYPSLQLPDTTEFQLFSKSHVFEQYDFNYKNDFWFKRKEEGLDKLPLRFVWGVNPEDNGDYLDPSNMGTLSWDENFDISDPRAQEWFLEFCQNLKQQTFYNPFIGPIFPNCFMDTFIKSMQRKCIEPVTRQDRTPCCETSEFPFNRSVFYTCVIEDLAEIYQTPQYLVSDVAGPKFTKDQSPTIKAVVVEYYSTFSYSMSFEELNEFFTVVESWMQSQLSSAPESMKKGFFISELEFYDLQRELSKSTLTAVLVSMALALLVLIISTWSILISVFAIFTITCSISVVLAFIVLLGWKLNVLESVAISTAIGLTVDFSLHYTINYQVSPEKDRKKATLFTMSGMSGPSLMAALTTGAAGAFMLPARVLPYQQLGTFLIIVMTVSWVYATFVLCSLLAIKGPQSTGCAIGVLAKKKYEQLSVALGHNRYRNSGLPVT